VTDLRQLLGRLRARLKGYDPNEPRDEGGKWTEGGGAGGAGSSGPSPGRLQPAGAAPKPSPSPESARPVAPKPKPAPAPPAPTSVAGRIQAFAATHSARLASAAAAQLGQDAAVVQQRLHNAIRTAAEAAVRYGVGAVVLTGPNGKRVRILVRYRPRKEAVAGPEEFEVEMELVDAAALPADRLKGLLTRLRRRLR
jgi:hypothetical protein